VTEYESHAGKLKLMGHPVRLEILDMLRQGEMCVCHIEKVLHKRQAYISQQLMALRSAGLVTSRQDGLQVYYQLADSDILNVLELLYGSLTADGLQMLPDCTCPACSTIVLNTNIP